MQTKTVKICSFHPGRLGGGGNFTIHGKTLVRTFVDVGDLFLGALDSECSWRLQSEGEPDTQEDFGVKDKHKLQHLVPSYLEDT